MFDPAGGRDWKCQPWYIYYAPLTSRESKIYMKFEAELFTRQLKGKA
jgi:hypothetical protein